MALWDEVLGPASPSRCAWVWNGDGYESERCAETFVKARRVAGALRHSGVGPGTVVAAVITNSLPSVAAFLGAWWAGAAVASLPIIARGQTPDEYAALLRRLCDSLGAECLLIEGRFAGLLSGGGFGAKPPILAYEALIGHPTLGDIAPPPQDEVMFIQFSSGTTAEPCGVELTGRAIDAQLRLLADHISIDPKRDIVLMWLPLSHDMGFFGNMLAWYTGMQVVLAPPERFLSRPWSWFEDCARLGATLTTAPSFAYALAARAAKDRPLPGPLSLRMCLAGGEPISMTHLKACADAFYPHGLSRSAFTAGYGLAEATLAVSIGEPTAEPQRLSVHRERLLAGELSIMEPGAPAARELVSSGPVLPGFSVECDGPMGELRVRGPSLGRGYHGRPELSAARFREGQLSTGDLGFVHDGEVYVVGRLDDRLIVGGRNIDVAGLEQEIADDSPVRKGNCAVVDLRDDTAQQIVLVAEAAPGTEPSDLLRRARSIAARRHGLRIDEVVILDDGEFPKTPSGKTQRYRCREIAAASGR